MSTRKTRRGIYVTVVATLAATVVGLADHELRATERPHGQAELRDVAPVASTKFDLKPTVLVVGDSYAATYPYVVADRMGWSLALDVQDGTGFVDENRSTAAAPLSARLDGDAATYRVDYVLIDAGRKDLGDQPDRVAEAADQYTRKVHTDWPKAKIIIILPAHATPDADGNYPALAERLRRTAASVGGNVIDPVAQQWYRDVDAKMLVSDGAHLNSNGDTYYADRVVENLKQMFDRKPTLLAVGDSFAAGIGDPKNPTYPHLVAQKMGWNLALDAQAGTGFLSGIASLSPPTVPFIDRLDRDAATYAYHVEYVLVDGGRSDLGLPPERIVAAADDYIKKVHSHWPNAKILIILPGYPTLVAAESYSALTEGLRQTAHSVGAEVIDPAAQRWYGNIDGKALMWRDGAHLNSEGDTYYADKVMSNLKRMGLAS